MMAGAALAAAAGRVRHYTSQVGRVLVDARGDVHGLEAGDNREKAPALGDACQAGRG